MTIEIYYFSGTGNSLFIAQELKKRLPECSLVPIGTKTEISGRYHHAGITAEDIARQK